MSERFVPWRSLTTGTEIPLVRDGVPSFLGVSVARTPRDLEGADAAIVGIPYDRPPTASLPTGQWARFREAPASRSSTSRPARTWSRPS